MYHNIFTGFGNSDVDIFRWGALFYYHTVHPIVLYWNGMAGYLYLCLNQSFSIEPQPLGSTTQEGCDLDKVTVAESIADGLTAEDCLQTAPLEAGNKLFWGGRTGWCISMFITDHSLSHWVHFFIYISGASPLGFWWASLSELNPGTGKMIIPALL